MTITRAVPWLPGAVVLLCSAAPLAAQKTVAPVVPGAAGGAASCPGGGEAEAERFYAGGGGRAAFAANYQAAITAYLQAERALCDNDLGRARRALDALWARQPVGSSGWDFDWMVNGTHTGTPPAYYALRMMDDIVTWEQRAGRRPPRDTATLAVVLLQCAEGTQPRTLAELRAGRGTPVRRNLLPEVVADDHRLIRESTALWRRYVETMTQGGLALDVTISTFPECLPVSFRPQPYVQGPIFVYAEHGPIYREGTPASRADWVWLIVPSLAPAEQPDFARAEFVTGGMSATPRNGPMFLSDDQWLVTRPNHLGRGRYTDLERRIYLPQWLQHEFFHHLFRSHATLGLEARSHQWFDRTTWPRDFAGRFEPDYYHEALWKRLMQVTPPLAVALRTAPPPPAAFTSLTESALLGRYVRDPYENGYHDGTIARGADGQLRWTNVAGLSWTLTLDLAEGRLMTGPDNPYYADGHRAFEIELERDAARRPTGRVRGFRFGGELYVKR